MTELEQKIKAKIPGEDTGIVIKKSFCDVCAPGPHCGVNCYVKDGRIIKIEGTPEHPCNHGLLCTKGSANRQYIYRKDRIKTPLKRVGPKGSGEFEPISWDEAFAYAASEMKRLKAESGAESVAFFSGYEKWYRPFLERFCYSFGSPNYGTESSTCFTSSVMSWRCATGVDAVGTDLGRAGIFLGWASNPYFNMHLMIKGLQMNKARGMKIVVIDPRVTAAAEKLADLHLRPRPGTDGALALAIAYELINNGWANSEFIAEHVYGYDEYKAYVQGFPPEKAEELTGVPADDIRLCARMIHENSPLCINQSSAALGHHYNGMQNHRAIMALSALCGTYAAPGGLMPNILTYAHSMGGFETLEPEWGHEVYPHEAPLPVGATKYPLWQELVGEMQSTELARAILEGDPYPVRGVWAHGMNFRMFNGDSHMAEALKKLDFFADIDMFMTDTAKFADLVLPCCSSFERSEFKVWMGGWCGYTEPVIEPLYESRSDTDILFGLAEAIDLDDLMFRSGYEKCVQYMLRNTEIDLEELKKDRQHPQRVPGFKPGGVKPYKTPTGKFELWSTVIEDLHAPGLDPLPTYTPPLDKSDPAVYPLTLVTGARLPNAIHSRFHDVSWARSLRSHPMADISREDAEAQNIKYGDTVTLSTTEGSTEVTVNPTHRVPKGSVFLYHGYRENDANALVPWQHNDPYSGFPGFRSCRCSMVKKEAEV